MSGIPPTPRNLRAEMARHRIKREAISEVTGINPNLLTMYCNEHRTMPAWEAHDLGLAINQITGRLIFQVADTPQRPRKF